MDAAHTNQLPERIGMKTESELLAIARKRAKSEYHKDGQIEIDDDATVSAVWMDHGEPGAYVQAWVWVDMEDILGRMN